MHLDEKAVRSKGDSAFAKFIHQIGAATSLAGINHHRQVRFFFRDGHRGEIERVSGVGLKGADAPLAQHHVRISMRENVLRAEKPLLDPFAHAAFEQNWFSGFGALDEQLKVLRVAGSDLEDVGALSHMLDIAFAQNLSDYFESGFLAGGGE